MLAEEFSPKPIPPYAFTNAKDPRESMIEEEKDEYDIFMYEAAGNIQAANELRIKQYERKGR